MHVIAADNLANALGVGLSHLAMHGRQEESRAGPVIVAPTPVTTRYLHPERCVLFGSVRDANPFLHLVEAAWMLMGRDDAAFLTPYVARYATFAEDDGRVHGAYGKRWRQRFGFDQLNYAVEMLTHVPDSRQCVIQMWDAYEPLAGLEELEAGQSDLRGIWRDRPCNTHVYLRVRPHGLVPPDGGNADGPVLDITVCCRSNDMVWGGYGANAVTFGVLHQYLAARIGAEVGNYYQVSNNYHVYLEEVDRLFEKAVRLKLMDIGGRHYSLGEPRRVTWQEKLHMLGWVMLRQELEAHSLLGSAQLGPVVCHPQVFESELRTLEGALEQLHTDSMLAHNRDTWSPMSEAEPWLDDVWRAALTHALWRSRGDARLAMEVTTGMRCPWWNKACTEWLGRRAARQEEKA